MKITLVQTDIVWENPQANFDRLSELIIKVPNDTDIIVLPEMFSTGFTMAIDHLSEPVGAESFEWLRKTASATDKIVVGSILTDENNKYYNRMYWMHPDGHFSYYDKRHLFHQGGEDKVMTAGNRRVIVEHKGVKFMLQICYDLRFPVAVKNNYNQKTDTFDYDTIIYIANWPQVRKQAYTALLKARAIENQSYVIWVNRVGADNKNIKHSGNTQMLDAYGNIVAEAKADKTELLNISLDIEALKTIRKQFQVGRDWDIFKIL